MEIKRIISVKEITKEVLNEFKNGIEKELRNNLLDVISFKNLYDGIVIDVDTQINQIFIWVNTNPLYRYTNNNEFICEKFFGCACDLISNFFNNKFFNIELDRTRYVTCNKTLSFIYQIKNYSDNPSFSHKSLIVDNIIKAINNGEIIIHDITIFEKK